ncbi:YwqG family protein [Nonomuraea sp. NPDC049725]|uniref:YwqG family protein n=1 Tax=Nonomuraea sp. NPDC049725 TaxID=3154508 RepID=UPI0034368ABA
MREQDVNVEALEALLRTGLPAKHEQARLELAEPGLVRASDGSLGVRLRLHNEDTGESAEQAVQLVPAGQTPERTHAYVQAWVQSLPSLLACVVGRTGGWSMTPGMLEFSQVALKDDEAQAAPQFLERFTDPRTLQTWVAAVDSANDEHWIRAVCQDLRLGQHADALVALRRPGIGLAPRRDGVTAGRTHLGGLPDLPPGALWPHRRNHPMTLLAQFDLAETNRCDDERLLPPAGLLQIFADLGSGIAWDDTAHGPGVLVMTQPPQARDLIAAEPPAGAETLPHRAVIPVVDPTLPPLESPFYNDLTGLDLTGDDPTHPSEEFAAFIEFLNEFHPPLNDDDRPRHRLLGYADPLQDDPWRHCATAEPSTPPTQWQLLAQIDSEPDAQLGDNGLVYIFIPRDALDAGDFTRSHGVWQMH